MTDGQLLILILVGLGIYVWMLSHLPNVRVTDADLYEEMTEQQPFRTESVQPEYDESGNVSKVTVLQDYRKAAR